MQSLQESGKSDISKFDALQLIDIRVGMVFWLYKGRANGSGMIRETEGQKRDFKAIKSS